VTDQTVFVLKLLVTALVAAALSVVMQARASSDPSAAGAIAAQMEGRIEATQ
jgi:hypothetical protein